MTTAGMTPTLEWCNQCCAFHRNGHGCPCERKISQLKSEIGNREKKIVELRNLLYTANSRIEELSKLLSEFQSGIHEIVTDRCGSTLSYSETDESVSGIRFDPVGSPESSDGNRTVEKQDTGTLAR